MKSLVAAFLLGLIGLAPLSARAMSAAELEQAKQSAQMIARKSAQYELCGVTNSGDLRKSLLDFGQRCGAGPADLAAIGKTFDTKRREQMKALVNGNYVCPVQASQAREMISRDLVSMGAVDCKPAQGTLKLK
jgi:hypothetical protein